MILNFFLKKKNISIKKIFPKINKNFIIKEIIEILNKKLKSIKLN